MDGNRGQRATSNVLPLAVIRCRTHYPREKVDALCRLHIAQPNNRHSRAVDGATGAEHPHFSCNLLFESQKNECDVIILQRPAIVATASGSSREEAPLMLQAAPRATPFVA